MEKKNHDLKETYVSGYKVNFSEPQNLESADIPARAMFYGEIGEKEKEGNNTEYTQNVLDESGRGVPANYFTDDNGGSEA